MPDLDFKDTTEFRGLEGQDPKSPSKDKIFLWAEFDTRFYENVLIHEAPGAKPGKIQRQFLHNVRKDGLLTQVASELHCISYRQLTIQLLII